MKIARYKQRSVSDFCSRWRGNILKIEQNSLNPFQTHGISKLYINEKKELINIIFSNLENEKASVGELKVDLDQLTQKLNGIDSELAVAINISNSAWGTGLNNIAEKILCKLPSIGLHFHGKPPK